MNTERTEKFVNAIACDLEEGGFRQVSGTTLRRALATAVSAALPLLEAGNPVSELAEQQGVELPPLPRTHYNAYGDGSEPLYTAEQMEEYALDALAATGKQQVGEVQGDALVTDEMVQAACKVWAETPGQGEDWMRSALQAALAARQPGAQGIELGQLRELAESWKGVCDPDPTPIMQAHQHANHCCADELLALIDGQRDAAPGVQP